MRQLTFQNLVASIKEPEAINHVLVLRAAITIETLFS